MRTCPAAALLCVEAKDAAINAAVKALEYNPDSKVLEHIAAAKGPDIQEVLVAILEKLSVEQNSDGLQKIKDCYSDLL